MSDSTPGASSVQLTPPTAGLPLGQRSADEPPAARSGDELIAAAGRADALSSREQEDLLGYFMTNGGLPGDDKPVPVEFTVGEGSTKRTNVWKVRPIAWEDWQDSRENATDEKTGEFDVYIAASYSVARALVEPQLFPMVRRLQEQQGEKAPANAAVLLQRMFRRQSGTLLAINGEVLRISKLQADSSTARTLEEEIAAGKD